MEKMDWKEEYKQAFESNRLKRFFIILSLVAIPVMLIISGWLLGKILQHSQNFNVRSISVSGLSHLDEASLYAITKPYYGQNIFSEDLGLLRKKIADIPWVKSAKVRIKLPDSVRIIVKERDAAALINSKQQGLYKLFVVDGNGMLLGEFGNMLTEGLPVITGLEITDLYTGAHITQNGLLAVLGQLASLRANNRALFDLLQEINLTESYGMVHYKVILSRRNIVLNTDVVNAGLFERLDALLRHYKGRANIREITALSNSIYVSDRS
jgi:cell division septal protein FtsQ